MLFLEQGNSESNALSRFRITRTICCCVAFSLAVGCNSNRTIPSADSRNGTALGVDDEIPDGPPDALLDFLFGIDDKPLPETLEARSVEVKRRMQLRVKACDRLLALELELKTRLLVTRMKVDALRTLSVVDPEGDGKKFETYVTSLLSSDEKKLQGVAKLARFQSNVNRYLSDLVIEKPIVEELSEVLTDVDALDFANVRKSVGWIMPSADNSLAPDNFRKQLILAAQCYRIIGNRFKKSSDPEIKKQAGVLAIQADDLVVDAIRPTGSDDDADARNDLREYMTSGIKAAENDLERFNLGLQTAEALEFEELTDHALTAYEVLAESFEDRDQSLLQQASSYLDSAQRRLSLIGNELQLSGILRDGSRFDWATYRGKHVLVCFWASYVPWLEEVEKIDRAIDPFRNRLQVVTVNLDNRKTLDEFCKGNESKLIWPTVVSSDPNASGFEQVNAKQNGVIAIPFLVLVGPDGRVSHLHVFGDRLASTLQDTLGP